VSLNSRLESDEEKKKELPFREVRRDAVPLNVENPPANYRFRGKREQLDRV